MSTDTADTAVALPAFDPACGYRLSPSISVRPEPFGALLYDFHTRRLSFLKTPTLVRVVRELQRQDDVFAALEVAGVEDAERAQYLQALDGLAAAGTIVRGET